MSYQSPYQTFIFEDYSFDPATNTAQFHYSFDGERHFTETLSLGPVILNSPRPEKSFSGIQDPINNDVLEKALQLSFYLAGTSYYKAFPTKKVIFKKAQPDAWQAQFLQKVYTEGLSQFLFENKLELSDIATFEAGPATQTASDYNGEGIIALQSGGKDSLLLATLLEEKAVAYTPWYIQYSQSYPRVLDQLKYPLTTARRTVDSAVLKQAQADGALNGHVPVTYIVLSYALLEAILQAKNTVLAAIGAEGGEPHEFIGDLPVNHQWAKTWEAEQLFAQYVTDYISSDLRVGSPLRGFSELKIAELFTKHAWEKFGHSFSSCNKANYELGADNSTLQWCGDCPKCANSYLLFAPFVEPKELQSLFGGEDLFQKPSLTETFKGLLGIDGVMKPFECVGETTELQTAYHMAIQKYPEAYTLPFDVPVGNFDYKKMQVHNQTLESYI